MKCDGAVLAVALGGAALCGEASQAQEPFRPAPADRVYQVLLLGNTGAAGSDQLAPTLTLLATQLAAAGPNSAVVFLGDLLPCCGMPDSGAVGRLEAETRLLELVDVVRNFEGRVVFIPGENDWGRDDHVGWMSVPRIEAFVETALDRGNVFVPDDGFPGPDQVRLTDDIRLVALNTQWLLTDRRKATGDAGDYDVDEDADVYLELEDLIQKRSGEDLLVVGHHPLYSNARYGGHYPPKTHLFPLTLVWDKAYLPLPVIGTIALTLRRSIGSEQHFANERSRWMRENLERILLGHEDFVYASAHDYSLQLFESASLDDMQKYVVSGSAAKSEFVAGGRDVEFTSEEHGFMSLHYYRDGSIWLDVWAAADDGSGRRIHEVQFREPSRASDRSEIGTADIVYPDYGDSIVAVAPELGYRAGWLQRLLMGSNHRNVWTTPIEVPVLDMGREHGGLTPLKRGGGMQTTSIRLRGGDGRQYVLRSVNKDGKRFLPEDWQDTFVAPISQDFLSYSHPLGAFIVPTLADAVGVYHANPKLVYVPSDPRLGVYQDLVGDMLMLYEERPNGNMSDAPFFGGSDDIVGAPEVYRRVTRDNDYRVDQRTLARARLFDMWMSDWDRHKDQWRWASYDAPVGNGKVYRPIPRDRDQAFGRLNFFLHPIIKPFLKFQDFRKSYGSLKGLTQNGRRQDHRFLNELELDDWLSIADSMQNTLTDEVIETAFREWPEPVFALHGEEMIEIGKARRDKLAEVARAFYRLHARSVDVLGSNKHERFEVVRRNDGETEVVVYKTSKEGEIDRELYRRVFRTDETDEIILYGLGGNDGFHLTGDAGEGIMVHTVGGAGDDVFSDRSTVGGNRKARFYDSPANEWQPAADAVATISKDPTDNEYTGFFEYPRTYPIGAAWYNSDDGFVILGGALRREHAFSKNPFARMHTLSGSFATHTEALQLGYDGLFKEALGHWDVGFGAGFKNGNNIRNFYGLGNETPDVFDVDRVRIRLAGISAAIPFAYIDEAGWRVEVAPKADVVNVQDDQILIDRPNQPGLSPFTTDAQWSGGVRLSLDVAYADDRDNPRRGFRWSTSVDLTAELRNAPGNYATLQSEVSFYASPAMPRQATLAVRVGGAHNVGTFPFYAANILGGTTNLRGYRESRFSGRSSFFTNSEVRVGLLDIRGAVLPGTLGALGFFDIGRVWTDGESSSVWHAGYGGGLWYNIVGEVLIRFTVGLSPEKTTFLGGAGFFF